MTAPEMEPVIFVREDCWYVVDHLKGAPYEDHAKVNPGTLLILSFDGIVLWSDLPDEIVSEKYTWPKDVVRKLQ